MLNPLRALKGKLNYLKFPTQQMYKIIQLSNSLQPTTNEKSSLQSISLQQIKSLKNENKITTKQFYKFLFDYQCHNQNCLGTVSNSIYQDLIPEQTKLSASLAKFTGKLNVRQLAYLNLKIRQKVNGQIPHWDNLHLNNDSPSKRDILVLPTLSKQSLITQLKSLPKKNVSKNIKSFHDAAADKTKK